MILGSVRTRRQPFYLNLSSWIGCMGTSVTLHTWWRRITFALGDSDTYFWHHKHVVRAGLHCPQCNCSHMTTTTRKICSCLACLACLAVWFSDCFVHCGVKKASVKRTQMDLDLFMLYLLTEIEKKEVPGNNNNNNNFIFFRTSVVKLVNCTMFAVPLLCHIPLSESRKTMKHNCLSA